VTGFNVDGSGTVYLRKGLVSAEECQFAGNSATGNGGVFMVYQGVLYTQKCSFEENTAAKSGGAVYVYRGGYDSALSRFERNHATTYGGGVYIRDGNFLSHANAFFDNSADGGYGRSVFNQGTTTFTCPDGLERYRFNENYEEYKGDIDGDLSPPDYCAIRVNFNQDSLYGDCDDIDKSAEQVCNIRAALGKAERLGGAAVLLEPGSVHYLDSRMLVSKAVPIHIKPDKYNAGETGGNFPRAIVAGTTGVEDGGFLQVRNLYSRTVLRDIIIQEFHTDTMNGGAVNVMAGHFEAIDCIFQYNSAPLGGAVFVGGSDESSSLTSNLAQSSWTKAAFMTTNTLFRANHAKATSWSKYMGGGGALYVGNWGYAFVESSDFLNNGMSRAADPDSGPAISVSRATIGSSDETEDVFTGILRWGCNADDMLILNEPMVVRLPNPEYSMYCGPWVFQNATEADSGYGDDASNYDDNNQDASDDSAPLVRIMVDSYEDSVMGDCSSPNSGSCNIRVALEMAANVAEEAAQQGLPGGVGIIYVPVQQVHQITEGHIILDRAAHIRLQAVQLNAYVKSARPITISGSINQHRFLFLNHKDSVLEFDNTIFENFKKSDSNGGVFFVYDGAIQASNCDFIGNSAFSRGGAFYVHLGHVTTSNSRYLKNNVLTSKSGYGGGAVYLGYGTFTSDSDVFEQNEAISSNGGGIFSLAGSVDITAGIFSENVADSGGAIYSHKGNLAMAGTSFVQNRATVSHGGAIYAKNGKLNLKASAFSDNSAQDLIGMSIYSDQVTVGWSCNDGDEITVAPSSNNLEYDLAAADYCQEHGMNTGTGDVPANPSYRRAKVVHVNMFVDSHDGSCVESSPNCNLRAAIKEIVEVLLLPFFMLSLYTHFCISHVISLAI
jgi:predicted outer membrane repeat protein